MSRQAERSIRGLIEEFKAENGNTIRVRTQLKQLEQKMDQVRLMVGECDSEEALRLMTQTRDRLMECERLMDEGKAEQAERIMNVIRKEIRQMYSYCSDQDALESRLGQIKGEITRLRQQAQVSNDSNAGKLLEKAGQYLNTAEQLCNDGNFEACAANIKAAQMNIQKAKGLLGL